MPIKVKLGGTYRDAASFVKRGGVYVAAVASVKAGGVYSLVSDSGFDPATRFATGVQGAWYDPSDIYTLFQDAPGTIPVTSAGQSVRRMLDKSGRGNHMVGESGASPVYEINGGLPCLRANGTTTRMYTASGVPLTAVNKLSCSVAIRIEGTGNQCIFSNDSVGAARFNMLYLAGSSPALRVGLNAGSESQIRIAAKGVAPYSAVNTAVLDVSGATATDEVIVRQDGSIPAQTVSSAGPAGSGNFSSQPFCLFSASAGSALFSFNGLFFGALVVAEQSTSDQLLEIDRYLGEKCGLFF